MSWWTLVRADTDRPLPYIGNEVARHDLLGCWDLDQIVKGSVELAALLRSVSGNSPRLSSLSLELA